MNTQLLRDFDENVYTEGFDVQAGQTWIYPINYPLRNYQYNIVSEALYKNTLVSLPTGLGKTFIAAVLMYNFYRWFPSGKVVFMAPTKPLVKQQLEACYNIMAIPKDVTAELTGTKAQISRKDIWMNKRVFFITPQVLQNDLSLIPELGKQIKCIVIDEAHKAKGKHAYCEVLRQIVENNKHFRVLALSATPGSTINDVTEIINNLLISHLEIRTDDSPDVMPYVFQRTMETIVVPLGEKLESVKAAYLQLLEKYTRILVANRIIGGNNCANLTKGRIFMIMKEFQDKNRHTKMKSYGDIMRNLNICVTLYHGYELLTRHGLRAFFNFFEEHSDQALLRGNLLLGNIKADVQEYLGPAPPIDILPDGSPPEISPLTKFGHPKFYKLQEILLNHFSDRNNSLSKVIVFTEYRESVKEIYALLIQHTPVIKPKYFLGQSSITQKQQILAINSFRSGDTNTLVSTCIGEEGLDIGEVDLIICFDISNKSPIRMVQRMGRTGRKKEGKIIVLVTQGKEEEILKECLVNKHYLSKNILKSKEIHSNLFQHNPRMVPESLTPTCQKIHISVPASTNAKKGNLKSLLSNMAGSSKELSTSQQFSDIEIVGMKDRIPDTFMVWDKGKMDCMDAIDSYNKEKISFSKRLETLRVAQPTGIIEHSKNCDILTSLMQFADSKRYNIPVSQTRVCEISPVGNKKTKFGRHNSADNFKQSDIRTMFLKSQAVSSTQAVTKNDTENIIDLINKEKANDLVNELHSEISSYISLSCIAESDCKICDKLFICYRTTKRNLDLNLESWIPPDTSVLNDLNRNNILKFEKLLNPAAQLLDNTDLALFADIDENDWNESRDKTLNFTFEPPKSVKKVCEMSKIEADKNKGDSNMDVLSFFKLDGIQHIFNDEINERNTATEMVNLSPILSSISQESAESNRSPVLSTFAHKPRITISRKLFDTKEVDSDQNGALGCKSTTDTLRKTKPNLSNLSSAKKSNFFKLEQNVKHEVEENPTSKDHIGQLFSNIQDFCDLSLFGIDMSQKHQSPKQNDKFEECHKEISNSGSDDLFGSCSNSPVKNDNKCNNLKDIFQHSATVIDALKEDRTLIENDYFDGSSSPILAKDILKIRSQRCVDGSTSNQITPTNRPNNTNKQTDAPQKISEQEVGNLSAFDVCDISIFGLQNAGSTSDDSNAKKEESKKEFSNKNTSDVFDFCDLSFFGVQDTCFVPNYVDTPKASNSSTNPVTSQILDIVNNDNIQTSQKENHATNVNCPQDTSSLISSNKIKSSSIKSNHSKRRLSIASLSDDDFSEIPTNLKMSKAQITQRQASDKKKLHAKRKKPPSPIACDSGDEFEDDGWISVGKKSVQGEAPPKIIEKVKKKKKKRIPKTYIDDEAVLTSSDEAAFKDSQSEPSTTEDVWEASFVNDETFANTTVMHAKYLQSTRSPLLNKGAFKIPAALPALRREIVFSQEVNNENDTYVNDTFCVGDDIALTQDDELSELELAERLLEEEKQKKTKKNFKNRKKFKIIVLSSDSD